VGRGVYAVQKKKKRKKKGYFAEIRSDEGICKNDYGLT
jgi:hypothetical protein